MNATIEQKIANYMQRLMKQQQRDDEIKRLRWVEKWTLQRIGDQYGLTRARIQQIVGKKKNGNERI